MPIDPGTPFTFIFGKNGVMRLEDNEKSIELLKAIEKFPELTFLLGEDPMPTPANFSVNCLKPDPGNKPTGCQNTQCPMKVKIKLTDPVYDDRLDALNAPGGGGE